MVRGKVYGVTGNTGYYGQAQTGEYITKLEGQAGRNIYDEMRRSDPQVKSILQAITLPLRQANYFFESASDKPKDKEIAEIASKDFLEDMSMTWDDTIRHAALMFPFGFSVLEKLWAIREKRVVPHKLDPRLPMSIHKWEYNKQKKKLIGPVQSDSDGKEYLLPIKKILVFTTEKEGSNWEGLSVLRAAYKPWYVKDQLERVNAIKHDRHGVGIPTMKVPSSVTSGTKEYKDAENILKSVHANERSWVVIPEGYEFGIVGGGQKAGTDALPSVKYYDEQIARAVLAMFLMLGSTETGSRALGGEFLTLFMLSIQSFADYICEVMNRFCIKEYVDYNWNTKEYPRLKVRRIQKLDPQVVSTLKDSGVLTWDLESENALREELNLPTIDKRPEEKPQKKAPDPKDDIPDEEDEDEKKDKDHSDHQCHGHDLSDRQPNDIEKIVNFSAIDSRLDTEQDELLDTILEQRSTQIDKIALQLSAGRKIQNIIVPGKKDMFSACWKVYKHQFREGKDEVKNELAAQRPDLTLSDDLLPNQEEFFKIIQEELSLKVEGAADKLKAILATWALDLRRQGKTGKDLETGIYQRVEDELSDVTWKEVAATAVNSGWGAGRHYGAKAYDKYIDYAYYSALLDGNSCGECRSKDGTEHEIDDPEYITPNPKCKGGRKCRCLNVYVMKEESEVKENV